MENPATWTEIQKTINSVLDYTSAADIQAAVVYTALSKADMLVPSDDRGSACLTAIEESIQDWQKIMEDKEVCGLSLPSTIYWRLVKEEMVK